LSTTEPIKNSNRALIGRALSLNRVEFKKFQKLHSINAPIMNREHKIWEIATCSAKTLYDALGDHNSVAAALLLPVDRSLIKSLDRSLFSIITAYDKMNDFTLPTIPDVSVINNHYKMLIADPFLRQNFSGEDLLSAHFLMYGTMQNTLKKGTSIIELFYNKPIILSQMALSTAKLLNILNKDLQASQLRDAALNIIDPDLYKFAEEHGYKDIPEIELLKKKDSLMAEISPLCSRILDHQPGFRFEIQGRLKSRLSIAEKMEKKKKKEILDIIGLKIIVHCPEGPSQLVYLNEAKAGATVEKQKELDKQYQKNIQTLYNVRSALYGQADRKKWVINEDEADNYVEKDSVKANGYQALQDNYAMPMGNETITAEIQIVTDQMYKYNSTGGASHDKYKGGEGQNGEYEPHETEKIFAGLQDALKQKVYAFAYKDAVIGDGKAKTVYGPYELVPENGNYVMVPDVLSNIDLFNARFFKRYSPATRTEKMVRKDETVGNGELFTGEGTATFGQSGFSYYGTNDAKNAAKFYLDSISMKPIEIASMKNIGKNFLNGLINKQNTANRSMLDVIFLEKLFLHDLGYSNIDSAHFYIGRSEFIRERLKTDIGKYILGCGYENETKKITFIGHRESLLTRQIMEFLGEKKYNMWSVHKSLEGDSSIFEATMEDLYKNDYAELISQIKGNGNIRKTNDHVPANHIMDKKLKITFSKDEPGIIYSVYDFLIKNNCYISSFKSDETLPGYKPTAEFDIKFPENFKTNNKYINLLNELQSRPDTFIKNAEVEITKNVIIKI
jgi:ppGpp synthetase/RelA/SpoT-type nucleotidyltranferase